MWEEVPRKDIFLASKVGWYAGDFSHAYHPKNIRQQADSSLGRLGVDHLDLYYFHHCDFGEIDEYFDDAMDTFLRLREEGKIRFLGMSDWSPKTILRYAPRAEPDVLQPYRNVVDDRWESSGLAAWARENDVGVAFFSPFKHGLLLGKYDEPPELGPGDHRSRIPDFSDPERLAHFRRCRRAVERRFPEHPAAVLHALVGALLTDEPAASALVDMRRPSHANDAARIGTPLSPEDAEWVRRLYRGEDGEDGEDG